MPSIARWSCASAPAARSARTRRHAQGRQAAHPVGHRRARRRRHARRSAVTIAAMLGARLKEEVLLIDFDLHYGSLMLALDLEAIDALARGARPARPHRRAVHPAGRAEEERLSLRHGRRGAADRRLPGAPARGQRLPALVPSPLPLDRGRRAARRPGDPAPGASRPRPTSCWSPTCRCRACATPCACSSSSTMWRPAPSCTSPPAARSMPRRSAVKVADVERTLKRKVDCQIPADAAAALSAINFGKPLSEAAPSSGIVKALRPLVAAASTRRAACAGRARGRRACLAALRPGPEEEIDGDVRPAQQEARRGGDRRGRRTARPHRPPRAGRSAAETAPAPADPAATSRRRPRPCAMRSSRACAR